MLQTRLKTQRNRPRLLLPRRRSWLAFSFDRCDPIDTVEVGKEAKAMQKQQCV